MLGVGTETLTTFGAISRQTALQMAHGALFRSRANFAVAVTGIAGPGGGSAEKPVGLVHLAAKARNGNVLHHEMRYGDIGRTEIRLATVRTALEMLIALNQAGSV
jgi:nicotinamide-nucleotide amidase